MSLIGLEAGARIGTRVEYSSELIGAIVLICVGAVIAIGAL
jgi:putative Mn2+ efflux pump MntP